ncbi:MAG: DUF937 domain-containing protein [Pseudomonadota bacterium]
MSLLKMLQGAQGGNALSNLASQLGMDEQQVGGLAGMLAPAIGSAAKKRAESGGLESLLGQLKGEAQGGLFDDPVAAVQPEARQQGENFLEQILGSRDARDQLAQEAATRAGAEKSQVDQLLPALAAMLQGGMQRQTPDTSIQGMMTQLGGGTPNQGGGIMSMLSGLLSSQGKGQEGGGLDLSMITNMLDADGDGSALDDVLERIMK